MLRTSNNGGLFEVARRARCDLIVASPSMTPILSRNNHPTSNSTAVTLLATASPTFTAALEFTTEQVIIKTRLGWE